MGDFWGVFYLGFYFYKVAAVLANMSASDACRQEVTKCGGIPVLLRFLQVRQFEVA